MLEVSNNDIEKMERILKLEFQNVVNFLIVKKQQKDLEYYSSAKPSVEHKKTVI